MYPDQRVAEMLNNSFIPVRVKFKESPEINKRFGARWTPTLLVLDGDGVERHRIEGYLPVEDMLAELELGLGKLEFAHERYDKSAALFKSDFEHHPKAAAAAQARYWMGVSQYKGTNDGGPLKETAKVLKEKYPDSEWARKASVWAG